MDVLIWGFYNKNNTGDELFKAAFTKLFPDINFIFTDVLTVELLDSVNTVFFGGGSFLDGDPNFSNEIISLLKTKNIFYIGVGAETDIHPIHQELIKSAKLIAARSNLDKVQNLNSNSILIPDLVYALQDEVVLKPKQSKSVLILPNMVVVPSWNEPQWKHAAWNYFKSEFCQFLDYLIDNKYNINFYSLYQNKIADDYWAATEIINNMVNRGNYIIPGYKTTIKDLSKLFSQFDLIITQRYHGIVLAEMCGVPCISLQHHDKLKNQNSLSYYGLTKNNLIKSLGVTGIQAIETNTFRELADKVSLCLQNHA